MLRIPHNVLDLFQAEESQKKRRTQEGNDKGGPLLHSTQTFCLEMCQFHSLLCVCSQLCVLQCPQISARLSPASCVCSAVIFSSTS